MLNGPAAPPNPLVVRFICPGCSGVTTAPVPKHPCRPFTPVVTTPPVAPVAICAAVPAGSLVVGGLKGATQVPGGYIAASRGSKSLMTGTIGLPPQNTGSVGTLLEWMCVKAMMHASGLSWLMFTIEVPGTEPRGTTPMQLAGLPSE